MKKVFTLISFCFNPTVGNDDTAETWVIFLKSHNLGFITLSLYEPSNHPMNGFSSLECVVILERSLEKYNLDIHF